MNWEFQRKREKPTAKCCDWCEYFNEDFDCQLPKKKKNQLTHRMFLKLKREHWEFRYCKNYMYSKTNFLRYKKICEDNAKLTWL